VEAVVLTCYFDPRNRRILLEEQLTAEGAARSVLLSVRLPGEDEERDGSSSGSEETPAADSSVQRPTEVVGANALDIAPVGVGRCPTSAPA